jgi:hypothetical protein
MELSRIDTAGSRSLLACSPRQNGYRLAGTDGEKGAYTFERLVTSYLTVGHQPPPPYRGQNIGGRENHYLGFRGDDIPIAAWVVAAW